MPTTDWELSSYRALLSRNLSVDWCNCQKLSRWDSVQRHQHNSHPSQESRRPVNLSWGRPWSCRTPRLPCRARTERSHHIQGLIQDLRSNYLKLARSLISSRRIDHHEHHRKMERLMCQEIQLDTLLCSQPTSVGPLLMAGHGQFAQGFQFARRTRTKSRRPHPFQSYQPRSLVVGKERRIERHVNIQKVLE